MTNDVKAERDAIVAWLKAGPSGHDNPLGDEFNRIAYVLARAIERGEHLQEKNSG